MRALMLVATLCIVPSLAHADTDGVTRPSGTRWMKRTVTVTAVLLQAQAVGVKSLTIPVGGPIPAGALWIGGTIGAGSFVFVDDAGHNHWKIEVGCAAAGDISTDIEVGNTTRIGGATSLVAAADAGLQPTALITVPLTGPQISVTVHSTVDLNTAIQGLIKFTVFYAAGL